MFHATKDYQVFKCVISWAVLLCFLFFAVLFLLGWAYMGLVPPASIPFTFWWITLPNCKIVKNIPPSKKSPDINITIFKVKVCVCVCVCGQSRLICLFHILTPSWIPSGVLERREREVWWTVGREPPNRKVHIFIFSRSQCGKKKDVNLFLSSVGKLSLGLHLQKWMESTTYSSCCSSSPL